MISVREKVRFVETDLMGVVHHTNYLRWFEMARIEYLRQVGILLNDLMAEDIVLPVTDVECKYRASAKFDDYILIEAELVEVSKVKMVFTHQVFREYDEALLATGRTQNAFTTRQGKIIRLPDKYFEKLYKSCR
ncbi:thioesterase family protein [Sporomusa sp. KB1]|jgi:acyl-CoA thioester hydrolase|uniref:acyl-CoA thioesterase n=1 Tax=Sporomusa sp. KB1 TaxID=943346 RepID=UPI0011AA8325|nr:thioesterase family protein [Sporomusa sp. KB1]TWH45508.1 acyl-CoA thioester hydrolase [Sporomusa sp. KB1]